MKNFTVVRDSRDEVYRFIMEPEGEEPYGYEISGAERTEDEHIRRVATALFDLSVNDDEPESYENELTAEDIKELWDCEYTYKVFSGSKPCRNLYCWNDENDPECLDWRVTEMILRFRERWRKNPSASREYHLA